MNHFHIQAGTFTMTTSSKSRFPILRIASNVSLRKVLYLVGMAALIGVVGTSKSSAQTAGWSSATGYRHTETAIQRAIVTNANNAAGRSSGPSFVLAPNGTAVWLTDTADGDGTRMQNAINRYVNWKSNSNGLSLDQIKTQMRNDFAGSLYQGNQKNQLVDRIISVQPRARVSTNQQVLDLLGIRKQCLEWCNAVSLASGGGTRNYYAGSVTGSSKYRPGMGLYRTDRSHAAIIIDIEWNASGTPVRFKVAEANYSPNNWVNPNGTVPWQRTVQNTRITTLTGYRVVNFE